MADLNMPIAEKLERYRLARGIKHTTRQWSELLMGAQRNPRGFAQLLDQELARMEQMTEVQPQ
jgi:hypothetical protein